MGPGRPKKAPNEDGAAIKNRILSLGA